MCPEAPNSVRCILAPSFPRLFSMYRIFAFAAARSPLSFLTKLTLITATSLLFFLPGKPLFHRFHYFSNVWTKTAEIFQGFLTAFIKESVKLLLAQRPVRVHHFTIHCIDNKPPELSDFKYDASLKLRKIVDKPCHFRVHGCRNSRLGKRLPLHAKFLH